MVLEQVGDSIGLLFAAAGTICSIYAGISGHPKAEYKEDIKKVQDDRWNSVCNELGPIVADLYEFVNKESNQFEAEDLSKGDKAAFFLRLALDGRSELEQVEDALSSLDEPKRLYQECRTKWNSSLRLFLIAISGGLVVAFLQVSELSGIESIVQILIGVTFVLLAMGGIELKRYIDMKEEMDEMIEGVDFM